MEAPDALSRNPVEVNLIDIPSELSDEWYQNLTQKVTNEPERYDRFALKDGQLYKQIAVSGREPSRWIHVLPADVRTAAPWRAHDQPTSGRCGRYKAFSKLKKDAYLPNMQRNVQEYVKNCQV